MSNSWWHYRKSQGTPISSPKSPNISRSKYFSDVTPIFLLKKKIIIQKLFLFPQQFCIYSYALCCLSVTHLSGNRGSLSVTMCLLERIDASPVSVTDRLHKQLNALLRAVWQQGPLCRQRLYSQWCSWGPVSEEGGWGLAVFSHAYTLDVDTVCKLLFWGVHVIWRDVLMVLTCNLN